MLPEIFQQLNVDFHFDGNLGWWVGGPNFGQKSKLLFMIFAKSISSFFFSNSFCILRVTTLTFMFESLERNFRARKLKTEQKN